VRSNPQCKLWICERVSSWKNKRQFRARDVKVITVFLFVTTITEFLFPLQKEYRPHVSEPFDLMTFVIQTLGQCKKLRPYKTKRHSTYFLHEDIKIENWGFQFWLYSLIRRCNIVVLRLPVLRHVFIIMCLHTIYENMLNPVDQLSNAIAKVRV